MRLKKGFTLAEVLIVLMVIGAIATMTIPSMMRGVTDTQWKTAYKKAFNTIVNLCAMQRISGELPSKADGNGVGIMFRTLQSNLSVKDYTKIPSGYESENPYNPGDYLEKIKYSIKVESGTAPTYGETDATEAGEIDKFSPWINTEDNLSYLVATAGGKTASDTGATTYECGTKEDINAATTMAGAFDESCVVVVVDVNGLSNGPNTIEPQITNDKLTDAVGLSPLSGDRFYIYVGLDGATAGSKKTSVMGRIVADIK